MGLERNILKGEINKFRPVANHMGTKYADVLIFNVSLMKNPCNDGEPYLSQDDIDDINAWLTSPDYPTLFHMYHNNSTSHLYDYYGLFTDVQAQIVGDRIIGLTYTFTTNAPYAWTDLIVQEFNCDQEENNISLSVKNSDRYGYIYPIIKIHPIGEYTGTRTDITITNLTDGNQSISLSVPKTYITLDCNKSRIYDEYSLVTFENLGLSDIDYIYWPKLKNGQNQFTVKGQCELSIQYREPRKVGAF